MRKKGKRGLHVLIVLAVCAGLAAAVMLLWNALIPAIIGWSAIGYWQSLGLLVLCRLLLGGMGNMNSWRPNPLPANGPMREIHKKMCKMSRDERREFIRRRMEDFGEMETENKD